MAAALSRAGLRVTLAAPNETEASVPHGVSIVPAGEGDAPPGQDAYVLPVAYFMGNRERPAGCVVGDVADPMLLSYATREPDSELGFVDFERRVHGLVRCLQESDVLLHSGPAGRHYLLGMLSLLGRIAPGHPDPGSDVLDVPFAAPPREESPPKPVAVDPPLPRGARCLLWTAGVYAFFDGIRALRVFEAVAPKDRSLHFVVAGGSQDSGHPRDREAWEEFRGAVEASAQRDRIRFVPWVPYAERAAVHALASLGIVCTRAGVEDEISWRNRVVDAAWAGVPQVLDGDDDLTRIMVQAGAAVRVERSVESGAAAVEALLADDGRRREMSRAARALTGGPLSWEVAVRPLAARILKGGSGGGLSPRCVTPLRLHPRRWGSLLHRGEVSLRLRRARGKKKPRGEA